MENNTDKIFPASCTVGIELGSTRIKAVMTDQRGRVLAVGSHGWENRYENGRWTYGLDDAASGLRACYAALKADVKKRYGLTLTRLGGMGVSAMMHGYLVFDRDGGQLAPFVTWRNNDAERAAAELSREFGFHIPARWSVAHLYRAVAAREAHVPKIAFQTTLAGYVHHMLTGVKAVGTGEASGMFPIDSGTGTYDRRMTAVFDRLTEKYRLPWKINDILPAVLPAGESAGVLTETGARFLDPSGDLLPGVRFCPPEGDAGTGMVATNSVRRRTGNVSAGTSVFAMIVLDRPLGGAYPEIDLVTTPDGAPAAMVHCNNCTSDLNAWVGVFDQFAAEIGVRPDKNELFGKLIDKSLAGEADCGGVLTYNYVSGENITGITEGRPTLLRTTDSRLTLANFMRSQLYSAFATLKIGLNILFDREKTAVDSIVAHGGIFRTAGAPQRYLAAMAGAPVTVTETAGEGGAWGMALLAAYALRGGRPGLAEFLDDIFADVKSRTVTPDPVDVAGVERFMREYERGLPVVRAAVSALSSRRPDTETRLAALKERVYRANCDLVRHGLVIFTWGNVSAVDRETGLVVIKPSGLAYEDMTAADMTVVDLDGNVVSGRYKPSSDTPTHLALYREHPEIGGVVHTHSTYATAFAQAGRSIPAYGTTHADYFYGEVPCTRALTEQEISSAYETNTGTVINETLAGRDALAVPAVLVRNHGPFVWGGDAEEAVYNAAVLEQAAKMAALTENIGSRVRPVDKYLLDKHYYRKHGKDAYYGQK